MSKREAIVKQLSRVMCKQASSENIDWCPFCLNEGCKVEFSKNFEKEAGNVLDYFVDSGMIKKAKLL